MKLKGLNLNKAVITLIIINFFSIVVLIGIAMYIKVTFYNKYFKVNTKEENLLFVLIFLIVLVNIFIVIKNVFFLTNTHSNYNMQKESLERVEALNNTLRAQRHDFLNHLQVVHSLIELDEYEDAKEYIEKVYQDIKKVSRVLKTSKPAINALLQAKISDCESKCIKVNTKISSQLKNFKIPSWEMCRVLGNLIDNAIYELEKISNKDKLLEIEIYEQTNNYGFVVRNNGSEIPAEIKEKIFTATFTTKGKAGQGMGLAITKNIIESNNGNITVYSDEDFTEFKVLVPFAL